MNKWTGSFFIFIVVVIITCVTVGPEVFFPEYVNHVAGEFQTKYTKVRYPKNGVNTIHFALFGFGRPFFTEKGQEKKGLIPEASVLIDNLIEDTAEVVGIKLDGTFMINLEILKDDRDLRQICGEPIINTGDLGNGIPTILKGRGCFSKILNTAYFSNESLSAEVVIHEVAHKMIHMKYGDSISRDEKEVRVMGITEWMSAR